MSDIIHTESIGRGARQYVATATNILIEETATTALIFEPMIHEEGVRGFLKRFKKEKGMPLVEIPERNFKQLTLHEGTKIELKTEATRKFFDGLKQLYEIATKGVEFGEQEYDVTPKGKAIIIDDQNKRSVIRQLIENDHSEEVWDALKQKHPDLATRLSMGYIQSQRQQKLSELEGGLSTHGAGHEKYWQAFFNENKWIFGYGLNYQILLPEQDQPHYGGTRVDRTGGQRGDYLCSSVGDISFTVLVEIKTPETPLLTGISPIRSGAWALAPELTSAISQLQVNLATWEIEGARHPENMDRLEGERKYTVSPRGILLIGRLDQLGGDRTKRETFERFRRSIQGIEIITFDELYARARFIVEEYQDVPEEPIQEPF